MEITLLHCLQIDNFKMRKKKTDKCLDFSGHKQHRIQVTAASVKPQSSCGFSVGKSRTALRNTATALMVHF